MAVITVAQAVAEVVVVSISLVVAITAILTAEVATDHTAAAVMLEFTVVVTEVTDPMAVTTAVVAVMEVAMAAAIITVMTVPDVSLATVTSTTRMATEWRPAAE